MIISLLVTSPAFRSIYLLGSEWETHGMKMENMKKKEQFTSVSSPQPAFTAFRVSHHTLLDTM